MMYDFEASTARSKAVKEWRVSSAGPTALCETARTGQLELIVSPNNRTELQDGGVRLFCVEDALVHVHLDVKVGADPVEQRLPMRILLCDQLRRLIFVEAGEQGRSVRGVQEESHDNVPDGIGVEVLQESCDNLLSHAFLRQTIDGTRQDRGLAIASATRPCFLRRRPLDHSPWGACAA